MIVRARHDYRSLVQDAAHEAFAHCGSERPSMGLLSDACDVLHGGGCLVIALYPGALDNWPLWAYGDPYEELCIVNE